MRADLHWVEGPWPGRLAVGARPRGGDWLSDEVDTWKRAGIGGVLSLLTKEEEQDLGLLDEARIVRSQGLEFSSFPIQDRQVPKSESELTEALTRAGEFLSQGKNLLIHCRQGIGRTGLVAACLLVRSGMSPGAAIEVVSAGRGLAIPETNEQREWIERYAPAMMK